MTEPKFTPGPWVQMGWNPCGVYAGEDRKRICGMDNRLEVKEHDANAQLIAAAPDLYAALYNVMLEFGPGTMSDAAFEGACVALAKARGETIDVNALAD